MGFSIIGLIIGLAIILPSIIFMLRFPPKNVPNDINKVSNLFVVCERIGQICCLILLIFSDTNIDLSKFNIWLFLVILFMVLYYYLWIRYVKRGRNYKWLGKSFLFIPVPLAVTPVCVFVFSAIVIKSIPLGIAAIILAIGHITISYNNYVQAK